MTGPSFVLPCERWLPVRELDGTRAVVSGSEALEQAGRLVLDVADPLAHAAVVRLLSAVVCAAGLAPACAEAYAARCAHAAESDWTPAASWWREHREDFDLFHRQRPLFQDGTLHSVRRECAQPVHYLDYRTAAAMGRPLLADHRHLRAALAPLTPARAALQLLTQQMWAVGGRLRGSDTDYGPGANYGAQAAACGGLVWQPQGTLAAVLAWRTLPAPAGQAGEATWTYGAPAVPGQRLSPVSELEALTWLPRRILLLARDDGSVDRAHFAQGRHRAVLEPAQIGSADQVFTANGKRLAATAPATPEDTVQLLERWHHQGEGSLPRIIRDAAAQTGGSPPSIRVIGLATDKKKLLVLRDVQLPPALLGDERAGRAAALLSGLRTKIRELQGTWQDGSGAALLTDETFLGAEPAEQAVLAARAFRLHCPAPDRAARARDAFHKAVTSVTGESPMPLFVTADTIDPTEASVGQLLERRLHGIRAGEHGRGLMSDLRLWAAAPTSANQAVESITRRLPAAHRDPAMITAALYAVHAQHHAPPYGNAPLPRLMRAFGSGTSYGPRHPQTETLMRHLLATHRVRLLLPALTTLVRYAAAHGMTPSWTALADDLSAWSPATRERWAALFYTSQPLTEIGHHA